MEKNKVISLASAKMLCGGYNCSQAILYGMMLMMQDLDEDKQQEYHHIAAVFGGGLAGLRQSCGFISGAALGYSLAFEDRELIKRKVHDISAIVEKESGSWQCSKIIENYSDKSLLGRKKNCVKILETLLDHIYDDFQDIYN